MATKQTSDSFEKYAWFSVQVDQYYAAIRVFARHYEALKRAHKELPDKKNWPDPSCLTQQAKEFFVSASSALNYMGTTNIFADAPFSELKNLPSDMINFGFYTCYCFQWTLFENFIKESILDLIGDALLPRDLAAEIKKRERKTQQFLAYINSGKVFGHSPFVSVLPVAGWTPKTENVGYADLDDIREQRNKFIHAVENPSILSICEPDKERLYERSMWILRDFARNLDQDVVMIRGKHSKTKT